MKNNVLAILLGITLITSCSTDVKENKLAKSKHVFTLSDTIHYVSLTDTVSIAENLSIHEKLHFKLLEMYPNISENLLGPTFATYPQYHTTDSIVVEYGFFTSKSIEKVKNSESSYLPISEYVYVTFNGEYFKIDKNIQLLNNIIKENNFIPTSDYYEIYYVGPHNKPSMPNLWETEIRIPVKNK